MPRSGVEYASDQITIYRDCVFKCRYCWSQLPFFRSRILRGKYDPVEEAKRYARCRKTRTIMVSFTADPYQPHEADFKLTRKVLEALVDTKHTVLILTKNPRLALRDLDLMKKGSVWLGTTIVSLEKTWWEPYAPEPAERISALKEAAKHGVPVFVSIEPIIPRLTYPSEIVAECSFVDWVIFGAFNYYSQISSFKKTTLKQWYQYHVPAALK